MTARFCSHCRQPGEVARYRIAYVGLRFLDADCADRLNAMGMGIVAVTDSDQRVADEGRQARKHLGLGRRLALLWSPA